MALDDFAEIDEAALGGLDDLFDEPAGEGAGTRAAPSAPPEPSAQPIPRASVASLMASAPAPDAIDERASDDAHFLDAAAIDEELLSSVEDVLSDLDDLEQNEEALFGLQSELGARPRRKPGADAGPDFNSAFPDIYPVEPVPDADRFGALLPGQAAAAARDGRRAWLPTASILAANLVLLLFAWGASRSLRSGLQDVRDELDLVRTTAREPGLRSAPGVVGPASHVDTEPLHGDGGAAATPLPTFDEIALEVAQREMERGLYTSARRRLYAVLALGDRIEAERRDDVEARTGFLVADSYRREAETRREVSQ